MTGGFAGVDGAAAGLATSAFAAVVGLLAIIFFGSEDLFGFSTTAAVTGLRARRSASAST